MILHHRRLLFETLLLIMPPAHPFIVVSQQQRQASSQLGLGLQSMTFSNLTRQDEPRLLCDFLMELGASSTSIVDAQRGTADEVPLLDEPMAEKEWRTATSGIAAAVISGDAGVRRNVWQVCHVTAQFGSSTNLEAVADMVQEFIGVDQKLVYSIDLVPDLDWVRHVQQSWTPIRVENIVIRFPWHSDKHVLELVGQDHAKVVQLQLEGGIAFGTGEHATTQLCLRWIQQILEDDQHEKLQSILDYGAGSGVLGLAACALQPKMTAIGIDIDLDAVRSANANASQNKLNMQTYLPPLDNNNMDDESKSILMKAQSQQQESVLPNQWTVFDVCVANILAGPLVTLAPTMALRVRQGGWVGLSGIFASQADDVMNAYDKYFQDLHVHEEQEGWVLITGIRRP
jgi:ribosomal protein L11 methyltransferase